MNGIGWSKEIWQIITQSVGILILIFWLCTIAIRLRKQKFSYYYILVRLLLYRDTTPLRWLLEHKIYIWYALQVFSLLSINIGFIMQIQDLTLYHKPWAVLIGTILLGISVLLSNRYLNDCIKYKKEL